MYAREPLAPYQYKLVYMLLKEPLTADELRHQPQFSHWGEHNKNPTLAMVNRLRPLLELGWIERDEDGIYRATERAREAVCW